MTDALANNFCPNCGRLFNRKKLQPIESRNAYKGIAVDFYCESCKASGDIDLDVPFKTVSKSLKRDKSK